MTPEMIPVTSSNIHSIGHDGKDLYVAFKNDPAKVYKFSGVPCATKDAILRAESPGSHFHKAVKMGKFPCEVVPK
jgi:hypothetical protein